METFKKVIKKILYPHFLIVALLIPLSAVLLVFAFVVWGTEHPMSYVTYVISAYTLTVISVRVPRMIAFGKRIKNENKYVNRLTDDAGLRVKLSLYGNVLFTTAYAVLQVGLGIYNGSWWFHCLAIYYFLLSIMRFFLLRDVRTADPGKDRESELHRYRFCGVILGLMTLALGNLVFFITRFDRGFSYNEIVTIALAAYTFTAMTVAIVHLVQYRRYHSPLYSAAKAINLAAASVSMLTLETAMFSAFGGEDMTKEAQNLMTLLTGVGVCLFVFGLAVYMVVHANKELKKIDKGQ